MRLVLFLVAKEATIKNDMLSLIDIVDSVTIIPPPPGQRIVTPHFWLATVVECSIGEGTDLSIQLFIDGTELGETPVYVNTPSSGPLLQFGLGGNSPNIH